MSVLSTEGVDKVATVLAMQSLPDIAETILSYAYVVKSIANSNPYIYIAGRETCRYCCVVQEPTISKHDDNCIWVYATRLGGKPCY